MPTMRMTEFAELAGVSRAAITQAVKRRALALDANKNIDSDLPLNKSWLSSRHKKKDHPEVSPQSEKKTHTKENQIKSDTVSPDSHGSSEEPAQDNGLKTRQLRADIRVRENNAERLSIGNAQKLEELVVRDRMRQRIGILGGEIRTRFLTLPSRLSAAIHSIILSLLDPDMLAEKIVTSTSRGCDVSEVATIIRNQLGGLNPKSIKDLVEVEVTKALKGAKDAAARADLDSFDPS